ncbi:hypothetical protein ACI65C_011999 [Semiaphis heraclei]
MQRGPAQLSSVSDLYVSDEISVLLEEIHDLEPKGNIAPIDDEQEFEINGSQTGGSWLEVTNSMAGTPGSWDSHANYKHQEASSARYNGVVLHYDKRPMKTPSGVIRVLLLVTCVLCMLCLCFAGTSRLALFMLPMLNRIRFILFVTLFNFLVTGAILFLDVTHTVYLFPFNWGKLNVLFYVMMTILCLTSSSLVLHQVYSFHEFYTWVPRATRHQLLVAAVLGYLCALETLLLALLSRCDGLGGLHYRQVKDDMTSPPNTLPLRQRIPPPPTVVYSPSPSPSFCLRSINPKS